MEREQMERELQQQRAKMEKVIRKRVTLLIANDVPMNLKDECVDLSVQATMKALDTVHDTAMLTSNGYVQMVVMVTAMAMLADTGTAAVKNADILLRERSN